MMAEQLRAVRKVRGLTLLLRIGTLWRCGDFFFELPPLASDALLTTPHPLLRRIVEQAVLSPRSFQTALVVAPPS
jgi:hypothetical protein